MVGKLTRASCPPDERGLTLVEMLVVLTIIGITTAAAVLALGPNHESNGRAEALRLKARIQLAADDAMIGDRSLALSITPTSYSIVERGEAAKSWQQSKLTGLDDLHQLPNGIRLSIAADRLVLPLDSGGRPFTVTLDRGTQQWIVSFDGIHAKILPPTSQQSNASSNFDRQLPKI